MSEGWKSMSPRPMRSSAPGASSTVRESIWLAMENAMRLGIFALINPVTTFTEGRCVASTIWIPVARAFCAMRTIGSSVFRPSCIMRSASSSMMITMNSSRSALASEWLTRSGSPGSSACTFAIISLYASRFLAPAAAKRWYLRSISPTAHMRTVEAFWASVITGTSRCGSPL